MKALATPSTGRVFYWRGWWMRSGLEKRMAKAFMNIEWSWLYSSRVRHRKRRAMNFKLLATLGNGEHISSLGQAIHDSNLLATKYVRLLVLYFVICLRTRTFRIVSSLPLNNKPNYFIKYWNFFAYFFLWSFFPPFMWMTLLCERSMSEK